MNIQTTPRRSTLENKAKALGLELRRASGPNQIWSDGNQPGPNRWALMRRQNGGLSFVQGLGTLQDVSFELDQREITAEYNS